MDLQNILMVLVSALLCATMLLRPRLLALGSVERKPIMVTATRVVGALGLLGIAVMLIARYLNG